MAALSDTEVYACGTGDADTTEFPVLAHWDGVEWRTMEAPVAGIVVKEMRVVDGAAWGTLDGQLIHIQGGAVSHIPTPIDGSIEATAIHPAGVDVITETLAVKTDATRILWRNGGPWRTYSLPVGAVATQVAWLGNELWAVVSVWDPDVQVWDYHMVHVLPRIDGA